MKKNSDGSWFAFNREYMPLGWNNESNKESIHSERPFNSEIHTFYSGLTDKRIKDAIVYEELISRDEDGNIKSFHFYNDKTNPTSNEKYWYMYLETLTWISKFKVKDY